MIALLLSLVLLGCSEPVCDICTTSAIVYGSVRHSGAPVAAASVTVTPIRDNCTSGDPALGGELTTQTVTDGSYRAHSRAPDAPFTACIRVSVLESGSSGSPVTVDGGTVEFRADAGTNQDRDSVRVDVDLP